MPSTDSKKKHAIKKKIYENLSRRSLEPYSSSYETWVFENYTKERLKSLGIIH